VSDEIRQGDHVIIGPGPKVWLVDSVGRIGAKPPFARLRDPNWKRVTVPLDILRRADSDGP
jgi:hypothetical protein